MAYNKKAHLRDNIEAIRLMFLLLPHSVFHVPECPCADIVKSILKSH